MAGESKVTLKSSNDELFEVNELVAVESQLIKNNVEDTGTATAIPLPNVSSEILEVNEAAAFESQTIKKLIEGRCHRYSTRLRSTQTRSQLFTEDEIKAWDRKLITVDKNTLFSLGVVFFLKPSFDPEF